MLLIYLNNFLISSYNEYSFSVILLNIFVYVYLLINMFTIFFLFDLRYLKTLSDFKFIGSVKSISIYVVLLLMSFSGIPPLLGFVSKFLMFIVFFKNSSWFIVIFFSLFNFFTIYFYIQNFRFLVSKVNYNNMLFSQNIHTSFSIIFLLCFFNFFNLFGLLYIDDFVLIFNFISKSFLF